MKSTIARCCVMAGLLVAATPFIATADPAMGVSNSEPPVAYRDSAITSSIKARLAGDHMGGFNHIRVDTEDHGVVTLKGHARTQEAADRAIQITKDTDGVREVKSAIEIKIDD